VFATIPNLTTTAGGRHARRFVMIGLAVLTMVGTTLRAATPDDQISVREKNGTYEVTATFAVSRSTSIVAAVLTDYVRIPHYMPEVRTSQLIERRDDRAVIEQEAVARFLMFSKRVHLVLEVEETPLTIMFKDRCGQSFERYEGAWSMAEIGAADTRVSYRLTAKPVFDVPGWLLSRLLKRDATEMIERLRAEIAAR
jgi:ribosome-associated toxin RatA of RatAB toxin-antitoxin module